MSTKILGQDIQTQKYTTGGGTTAYTATVPNLTALYDGFAITVKMNATNTGSSTLNVNGLGAKTLKKPGVTNMAANDLLINSVYTFVYDLAQDFFFLPSLNTGSLPVGAVGYLDASNGVSVYLNSAGDWSASDVPVGGYAIVNGTNYLFCLASFYAKQNVTGQNDHVFLGVYALQKSTGVVKTAYGFMNQINTLTNNLNVDDTNGYLYVNASAGALPNLYYEFPTNTVSTTAPGGGAYTNVGFDVYEAPVPSSGTFAGGTATLVTDTYGGFTYDVIRTSVEIGASEAWAFSRLEIS